MTKEELSQLYYLNREIKHLKTRIAELEALASSKSSRITGLPGGSGISDKVGTYAVELAELKRLLEINLRKCFCELIKLSGFIESIEDSRMRMIMTLRYIHGLTWQQVAMRIGEHDEQYPRRKCREFLERGGGEGL